MFKVDSKKSPGKNGIGLDFFKTLCEEVADDMRTLYTQMLRDLSCQRNKNKGSQPVYRNARNPKHQRTIGP